VLAFSLVSLTAPAHADDTQTMKVWTEFKFAGDNVTISMKVHSTVQGADHKTMCNRYSSGGTSPLGYGTAKAEITQYEGVEVCDINVTAPLDKVISSSSSSSAGVSGISFKVERDGNNVSVSGDLTALSSLSSYGDSSFDYRVTFGGGIVSAEGAEVSGNTAKLQLGEKYKVVGNPGSGSSDNGGSSDNKAGSSNNGDGSAKGSGSSSSSSSSSSSDDNTVLYVIIGVVVVLLVGVGASRRSRLARWAASSVTPRSRATPSKVATPRVVTSRVVSTLSRATLSRAVSTPSRAATLSKVSTPSRATDRADTRSSKPYLLAV